MPPISKAERGTYLFNETTNAVPQYDFESWINATIPTNAGDPNDPVTLNKSAFNSIKSALNSFNKSRPIAMLPVKVESKFIGNDLWLRIFPDRIFVKSLEKPLTTVEVTDAKDYWNKYYAAAGQVNKQQEAWRFLCAKYGVNRAAWIIRQLFPTNLVPPPANTTLQDVLGKLANIKGSSASDYSKYISPEGAIALLKNTAAEINSMTDSLIANNDLKMSEMLLLKSTCDYTEKMFTSAYEARINPLVNTSGSTRTDQALHGPWVDVKASFKKNKKALKYESTIANEVAQIQKLIVQLKSSNKSISRQTPEVFLSKISQDFDTIFQKISTSNYSTASYSTILWHLSEFNQAFTIAHDKFNPSKDPQNPKGNRSNPTLESIKIGVDLSLNSIKSKYSASSQEMTDVLLETFSVLDNTSVFVPSKTDITFTERHISDLVSQVKSVQDNYSKNASRNEDESIILYSLLHNFETAFVQKYDKELNPYKTQGKIFSGRAIPSLDVLKTNLTDCISNLKKEITKGFNVTITSAITSLDKMSSAIFNKSVVNNKSSIIKNLYTTLDTISKSLIKSSSGILEQQVMAIETLHFFENYLFVYENEINPLKIANLPSAGGADPNLEILHRKAISSYKQLINDILVKSQALTHFNQLMQTESNAITYNINYTKPSAVKSKLQSELNELNLLKTSLIKKEFSKSDKQILFAATEELLQQVQGFIETGYNPQYDLLDAGKGARNPELDHVTNNYINTLLEIQASKETIDSTPLPQGFSYQFTGNPVFPPVETKDSNWTIQQYSDVLPSHFVAIGFNEVDAGNDQSHIKFVQVGAAVDQATIKFGFNPANADSQDSTAFDLQVNGNEIESGESLNWIFDKDIALEKGLAIKVPLTSADTYLSKVVVFGVKDIADIQQHSSLWQDLLLDHQYTTGISLLSVGTPTNNTSEEPSGFNSQDKLFNESFATFAQDKLFTATTDLDYVTDGQLFSEFLGLPYSSSYHIDGANRKSITNGQIGSRVLFNGTIGLHMEEALDNLLNHDNRKRIREFFTNYVSARGLTPSLRIGNQPYGLLITSNLQNYQVRNESNVTSMEDFLGFINPNNPSHPVKEKILVYGDGYDTIKTYQVDTSMLGNSALQLRFNKRLRQILTYLDGEWRKLAQGFAKNMYGGNIDHYREMLETALLAQESQTEASPTTEQSLYLSNYAQNHFMSVFGHLPYSYEMAIRYVINSGAWNNLTEINDLNDLLTDEVIAGATFGQEVQTILNNYAPGTPWGNMMFNSLNAATRPNGFKGIRDLMINGLDKGIYSYFDYSTKNGPQDISSFVMSDGLENKLRYTRAFMTSNAHEAILLDGAMVSKNELDLAGGPDGYLKWLATAQPKDIFGSNNFGNFESRSMLFLLARASTLAKYRQLAMDMMVSEGLATWSEIMALGTAENAIKSFGRISHYTNNWNDVELMPNYSSDYVSSGFNTGGTYLNENAWKFTKWNLLLDRFHEETPFLIGSRDKYECIDYDGEIRTRTMSSGDIAILQLFLDEQSNADYKWRTSSLLKFLVPNMNPSDGIFSFSRNTTDSDQSGQFRTVADFLHNPDSASGIYSNWNVKNEINKFKSDLALLSEFDNEELERITRDSIDLSSNRIDAWIHGLFNMRLKNIRNRTGSININNPGVAFTGGSYIGAFGYIENLKKDLANDSEGRQIIADISDPNVIPTELSSLLPIGAKVYMDNDSYGFLPAPTLTHAVTAAILNSTYQSGKLHEQSSVYNRTSVNLSSARIRAALFLLQGIQSGNDLGALLGQQFENGLHESSTQANINLDLTIHRLRKLYPMREVSGSQITISEDSDQVYPVAGEVVNGIAILDKIKVVYESLLQPEQSLFAVMSANLNDLFLLNDILPDEVDNPDATEYNALQETLTEDELKIIAFHIDQMAQSLDALGDLVITESVYQIASGNSARAAAAMGMLDGSSGLVDPEVIQSPLKANQFTNRLLMNYPMANTVSSVLTSSSDINDGWSSNTVDYASSPRTGLDQSLNRWMGQLLLAPDQIIVTVAITNTLDNTESYTYINLSQLELQPLDLLALVNVDSTRPTSEFERILLYQIRKALLLDETTPCNLVFESTEHPDGSVSFKEFFPTLGQLKELLQFAKPIKSSDFSELAATGKNYGIHIADYVNRIDSLRNYAESLLSELSNAIAFPQNTATTSDVSNWITTLERCVRMGIPGVTPASNVVPADLDEFAERIKLLCQIAQTLLNDRISKANEHSAKWTNLAEDSATNPDLNADLQDTGSTMADILLGGKAYCFPVIQFDVQNTSESDNKLQLALQQSPMLIPADEPQQFETWLHANGMVRRNVSNLMNVQINFEINRLTQEDNNSFGEILNPQPVQLPFEPNQIWVGSSNLGTMNPHGKCNLMVNAIHAITVDEMPNGSTTEYCRFTTTGFKLDEWNETIPVKEITAGITAHINQPGNEAPQTILLSVPASEEADWKWNVNDLVMSITQAVDMAKYRALETEHIGQQVQGDEENHLGKIFPANMTDVFPINHPGTNGENTQPYEYDGIRPSFSYAENNG
jgi:hypothetical protein